jgi:hypothetical protein
VEKGLIWMGVLVGYMGVMLGGTIWIINDPGVIAKEKLALAKKHEQSRVFATKNMKSTLDTFKGFEFNNCKGEDTDGDGKVRCQVQSVTDTNNIKTFDCDYQITEMCTEYVLKNY